MPVRMSIAMLVFLLCCGVCQARAERWSNFGEDTDLKYYIDQRSIIPLPDNVFIFWVKSVPKNKDYFKAEYNMNNVAYMFTSYELDCAVSSYRTRGTIMFDKNRKEISKSMPDADPAFEPVPPESLLELAQDEVCTKGEGTAEKAGGEERKKPAAPGTPAPAATPEAPLAPAPAEPAEPTEPEEPPALQ